MSKTAGAREKKSAGTGIPESKTDPILSSLASGKTDAAGLVAIVLADKKQLDQLMEGLSNSNARVKFGCSKALLLLSEKYPGMLQNKIEQITELLEIPNQILKWTAIAVLGNLAAVDRQRKVRRLLPRLYGLLSSGELITANHAIAALGKIGSAFAEERTAIAGRLIGVENCPFETGECRNIAMGKVILALKMFVTPAKAGSGIIEFVRRQTNNTRAATAQKAKDLLKILMH
jgi:hypothetical protein